MDKKISELDQALLLNNDADFPLSQDNAGEPTTFRAKLTQLATKIAEDMTFSNLQTTSKKLVGAINELLSLGNPIILGTSAPTSSVGANGNIYVQYTEGTGGADDEVDGIFVKIDGAWCEISTGGGSGTTDYEDLSNKPQVNSVELVGNKTLDDLGIMPASLSKTVSGSLVHITDGADNIPVKSLVSQIVATGGGGTPDAPIAISGFDKGIISRLGKNLFSYDLTIRDGYWSNDAFVGTNAIVPKENALSWQYIRIYVEGLSSITLSGFDNQGGTNCAWLSSENVNDVISRFNSLNKNGAKTVPSGAKYLCLTIYNIKERSTTYPNAQIEVGTATTYEAYNDNDYTFTFGQTVYGGHFDNKGNLVVTHKMLDLGSVSYSYSSSDKWFYNASTISNEVLRPDSNDDIADIISENYIAYSRNTLSGNDTLEGVSVNRTGVLQIRNLAYTDPALFKTAMSGVKFVYALATPITLAITSQDIPTLLGENNIFSNTGDVEVNYYTDNADEIVEVAKATASTPLHNYSTDEQIVGTWIDGSTLYQKSFVFTSSLTITDDWVSTPFSISGLDKIIDGIIWRVSSGGSVYIDTNVDGDNIRISTKSKNTNFAIGSVLTIRYTKSST